MNLKRLIQCAGLCAAATLGADASAAVQTVYLRAGITTQIMPDGRPVVMWGFAKEASATATDGTITVPGPAIKLPPGAWDLVISVNNTLPEPVSIMIPNQTGQMGDPVKVDGRIRSFTHETAPGTVGTYTFNNVKEGTFLYHSATHPAIQVQMGLYGEMTKLAAAKRAYATAPRHQAEASFIFSEIDPVVHDAVATGQYGPGMTLSSTIESYPQYFFINGQAYTPGMQSDLSKHISLPAYNGTPSALALLRFINAGINYHTPVFGGYHLSFQAEDGRANLYPKSQHSVMMAPLKTMDGYWVADKKGTVPVYDRSLGLANGPGGAGGMIAYAEVKDVENTAPVLEAIPDKITSVTYPVSFQAVATDEDFPVQTLTFTLGAGAPAGAVIDPMTGVFTWTPGVDLENTIHPITVVVTDSGTPNLSAQRSFTVRVDQPNVAPVLNEIANQSVDEETTLNLTFGAFDQNIPAQALTYSLGAGAPAGASVTAGGQFSWTPSEAQGPNSYNITVIVTDNGVPALSHSRTFTVGVKEVNVAPVLAVIADRPAYISQLLSFTATATDADLPANTVTFSLGAGAPAGAAITAAGAFTWTPSVAQLGNNTITVIVTDNGSPILSASQSFNVVVDYPTTTIVDNNSLNFSDNNTVNRSITVSGTLGIVQSVQVILNNLRHPRPNDLDVLLVSPSGRAVMLMSDVGGTTPLTSANQATLTFSSTASGSPNADPLTTGTYLPTNLDGGDADTIGGVSTPVGGWSTDLNTLRNTAANGTWRIYVRDDTSGHGSGSTGNNNSNFRLANGVTLVLQTGPNLAPVIAPIANQTVNELAPLSLTFSATDANASGGQTVSFSLGAGAPAGATVTAAGQFSWTPTEAQGPGNYTITVVAADNFSPAASSTTTFNVAVNEVNVAPVLTFSTTTVTIPEGTLYSRQLTATDADLPANALTYSAVTLPPGASLSSGGLLTWTPTEAQGPGGPYVVTVQVTDNGSPALASAPRSFNITVTEVNTAPVVSPIGTVTASEGVNVNLLLSPYVTDADLPANTLTYSYRSSSPSLPSGNTVAINSSSGLLSWVPQENTGGNTYNITFRVSDGSVNVDTVVPIQVLEVNTTPVLSAITDRTANVGQQLSLTATATDADSPANTLTFSLGAGAPAGAAITAGGAFTWTPDVTQVGTTPITVVVTDNGSPNLSASRTFNVTVGYLATTVANTGSISIPDSGSAGNYPRSLTVAGALASVQDVTVTLTQLRHPRPSDLDVLLVSPSGVIVMLISDCGGSTALTSANQATLTFSSAAASPLTTATLVTGTYLPTDLVGVVDTFVAPAPLSGWTTDLNSLAGTTANGTWSIYIRDNAAGPGGTGSVNGGVSITVRSKP